MSDNIKISAIITSGGNSSRFGSNKLLEKLDGSTVIETSILKFIDLVDEIIIPAQNEIKEFILRSEIFCDKIKFASAGLTRQLSVLNGIRACNNPEIVLIHDGARPFIDKTTIQKAIELTYQKKAVVVGKRAIDTIKIINDDKIISTLDRKVVFHAQTPQCFNFELIKNIHEKYKNTPDFTDDSSMVEHDGFEVYFIESLSENKKITIKTDLP